MGGGWANAQKELEQLQEGLQQGLQVSYYLFYFLLFLGGAGLGGAGLRRSLSQSSCRASTGTAGGICVACGGGALFSYVLLLLAASSSPSLKHAHTRHRAPPPSRCLFAAFPTLQLLTTHTHAFTHTDTHTHTHTHTHDTYALAFFGLTLLCFGKRTPLDENLDLLLLKVREISKLF